MFTRLHLAKAVEQTAYCPVWVNPFPMTLKASAVQKKLSERPDWCDDNDDPNHVLRLLWTDKDVYIWSAFWATHDEMAAALGLPIPGSPGSSKKIHWGETSLWDLSRKGYDLKNVTKLYISKRIAAANAFLIPAIKWRGKVIKGELGEDHYSAINKITDEVEKDKLLNGVCGVYDGELCAEQLKSYKHRQFPRAHRASDISGVILCNPSVLDLGRLFNNGAEMVRFIIYNGETFYGASWTCTHGQMAEAAGCDKFKALDVPGGFMRKSSWEALMKFRANWDTFKKWEAAHSRVGQADESNS